MEKLYVIIPAYNEESNIGKTILDWYTIVEKYGDSTSRLVIIDDGSKDCTYQILQDMSEKLPLLMPLTKENSGHGATILYGYELAIKDEADFVFQTDSDGQTSPDDFDKFWQKRHDYDIVAGNRTHRKDGLSRILVTTILKFIIYVCFGVFSKDANVPFRLMNTSSLKKIIHYVPSNYNLSNIIISVAFIKKKYKVSYIPITFLDRQGGVNSLDIKKIIKLGRKALFDFIAINKKITTLED